MSKNISVRQRLQILGLFTLAMFVTVLFLPRISQNPEYNQFADSRSFLGVPNGRDVLSNIFFLLAGILGLQRVRQVQWTAITVVAFKILSIGLILTCLGSAYYHLNPSMPRLVWDRLPMSIMFMGFFAWILSLRVSVVVARQALIPLLLLGIFSVFYWQQTESIGLGDLRFYLLVQFGVIVISALVLFLFRGPVPSRRAVIYLYGAYLLAKIFEIYDQQIFLFSHEMVSGHTLKHISAGLGLCCFVWICTEKKS